MFVLSLRTEERRKRFAKKRIRKTFRFSLRCAKLRKVLFKGD